MNSVTDKAKVKAEKVVSVINQINSNLSKKISDNAYLDKASWKLSNDDKFEGHESQRWGKGWNKWGK